ncbi:MAG: hypothetical protein K6T65_02130 [Peptococcaceae bacterium]|nr:hypothetical protein [Peptococcaceae bacterium]
MSAISRSYKRCLEIDLPVVFKGFGEAIKRIFSQKEVNHMARLYHVDFNYGLVPNTAISKFDNMSRIASLYSGDCYIYIFEKANYQGWYKVVAPCERTDVDECGSIIVSLNPVSIDAVQRKGRAPGHCWEMSGSMYLLHFYAAYRYA